MVSFLQRSAAGALPYNEMDISWRHVAAITTTIYILYSYTSWPEAFLTGAFVRIQMKGCNLTCGSLHTHSKTCDGYLKQSLHPCSGLIT